ncbi:MAG: GNAT family N-acetyltransferase [bacterium]
MTPQIQPVDWNRPDHIEAFLLLLDTYSQDPLGGNAPLRPEVRQRLPEALQNFPGAFSLIAWLDKQPVGLANCFTGFSTFAARPLINLHDLVVHPEFRGKGIGRQLLQEVERQAQERGCCKITLEVLNLNRTAFQLYLRSGFEGYSLDPQFGQALFLHKAMSPSGASKG